MLTFESFWNFYDCIIFALLSPVAFVIYNLLHVYTSNVPAAIILPVIMFLFISIAILISTPHQSWTTVSFALSLAGITVGAMVKDYAVLRECTAAQLFLYG